MHLQKVECWWPCTYQGKYFSSLFCTLQDSSLQRMFYIQIFIICSLHCKLLVSDVKPWPVKITISLHLVFSTNVTLASNSRCLITLKGFDYFPIAIDDMILVHQKVQLKTTKSYTIATLFLALFDDSNLIQIFEVVRECKVVITRSVKLTRINWTRRINGKILYDWMPTRRFF